VTGFVFFDADNNGFFDPTTDYGLGDVTVTVKDFETEYTVTTNTAGTIGEFTANVVLGPPVVTVMKARRPKIACTTTIIRWSPSAPPFSP
jgi:hypothetical protein